MVTHRHDEGPWECTPYCACTFATWQERDAHLDEMAKAKKEGKKVPVRKKVIRLGNVQSPIDVSDLNAIVDAYPQDGRQVYTWKGGKFTWQVHWTSAYDGTEDTHTVEIGSITAAYDSTKYHAPGFRAEAHPASGQWLVQTPEGFSIVPGPEEALEEISRVHAGLPPERTATVTVSGIVINHGVSTSEFAKEISASLRHSRYTAGTVTARQVKITEDSR